MSKRDAAFGSAGSSRKPQHVPAAFFLHFDPAFHKGQAAVEKHLEFFRATGMDLVKIQFEHPFPRLEIRRPKDWAKVPVYGRDFFEAPLRVVEGLVKASKKDALVLLTLYSPFMLAGQIGGPGNRGASYRGRPRGFQEGHLRHHGRPPGLREGVRPSRPGRVLRLHAGRRERPSFGSRRVRGMRPSLRPRRS